MVVALNSIITIVPSHPANGYLGQTVIESNAAEETQPLIKKDLAARAKIFAV